MLQSHRMRHFQQSRWKSLNSLFIMLMMFRSISQNGCIFPIFDVSIFEINYNKHSYRVFISPPVTVRTRVVRMRTCVLLLLFKNGGWQTMMHFLADASSCCYQGSGRAISSGLRVKRKAFPRVANV